MARVQVYGADVQGDRIAALRVKFHNLPARTIDRDTAIDWLMGQHSFVPVLGDGTNGPALLLVEMGEDEPEFFVRNDSEKTSADALGELPSVEAAGI